MQNGSDLSISFSPEIPKDLAAECFEVQLLGRMIDLVRTSTGYVIAPDARESFEIDLRGLRRYALESKTPLVEALRHVVDGDMMRNKVVTREDIASAMGLERFGIENVLQEICRQYEDSIPNFQLLFSLPARAATGGRATSGAQFITADSISTLDPSAWLTLQRHNHSHDAFQIRMDWIAGEDGRYTYPVPHCDWRQIAFGHAEDFVAIGRYDENSFEVSIEIPGAEATEHVGFYPSLAKAMRAGGRVAYEIENNADDKVLASMGLPAGEWELCERQEGIKARCLTIDDLSIESDADRPGEFTVFHHSEEIAVLENPAELLQHLPKSVALRR
ncbi:hypothetical protein G6L37_01490 [Agrobacterium rubi]|nr:hypothetical protein [Agrobacterium rubi]NTF24066.1 hypothetical protein [Agrobacterium rubi]